MRLKAIELDQVGTFSAPVRLDAIAPGLNVLAGANELGKSTLLRGLTALFTEQHRTTRQALRDLRPYGGGAPRMACTFELDGRLWHLEKRYLAAHQASLEQLDGPEHYIGADAENRLAELLGQDSGRAGALPLLWVGQDTGTTLPEVAPGVRHALGQTLAAEADVTSGVGPAQAVLAAVEAELEQLVTKTGRPRKNGVFAGLIAEHGDVAGLLDAARAKARDAEQRLEKLGEAQRVAADLADPETVARHQALLGDLEGRLHQAREAQRQLDQLSERVAFLEKQHRQAQATLADYDAGLREREEVAAAVAAASADLSSIEGRSAEVNARWRQAQDAVAVEQERTGMLRDQLEHLRRSHARAERQERLRQLDERHLRLATLDRDIDRITQDQQDLVWPDDAPANVRRAALDLERLQARQQASALRLRFTYEAGRSSGFSVDGSVVADGSDVTADGPVTIAVEGVGRVDVIPGGSEALAALARDLEVAQATLAAAFAAMGATDLADAEQREQRRLDLRNARQLLISERDGLVPEGADRLAAEIAHLRHQEDQADALSDGTIVEGGGEALCPEQVAQALAAAREKQTKVAAACEALQSEASALEQRRAVLTAELDLRRARQVELDAKYAKADGPDGAAAPRDELLALASNSGDALNAARRDRLAVEQVAMAPDALADLERTIADHRAAAEQRAARLAATRQDISHLEGLLARDFEDGTGDRVQALQERFEELDARLRDTQRHIAALQLLAGELAAEIAQRRDTIARPLVHRLTGLAAPIWPGAEIPLSSDLTVDGLSRCGHKEIADAISTGTREQVAVLARLAYAGLLAQGGGAVPVILDDPLVFSDDARLDVLFETMADVARDLQIIVLTCHERAFEPLITRHGATRLELAEASAAA